MPKKVHIPPALPDGYRWLKMGVKLNHGDIEWESYKGRTGWRGQRYVGESYNIAEEKWTNRPSYYARPKDRKLLRKLPECVNCGVARKRQGFGYGSSGITEILLHNQGGSLVCGGCCGGVTRRFNLISRLGGVPTINGHECTLDEAKKSING